MRETQFRLAASPRALIAALDYLDAIWPLRFPPPSSSLFWCAGRWIGRF